ncbi:MAG: class I SAM-dependent methyltransferase [Rhodospirillaceae bacterium]
MSDRQVQHDMLIQPTHDERARQDLCQAMRAHLLGDVQSGTQTIFNHRVHPEFHKEHDRPVKDRHEIRRSMAKDPFYRLFSASLRTTQELMWDSIIDTVEHETPRLQTEFKKRHNQAKGTLTLDPELDIPRYHTAADIHLQPGGYHSENVEDDLSAGAIFDRALHMYGDGKFGPYSDAMGHMVKEHLNALYPDFAPKRILDMGCSSGNSTLVYGDAFPGAEVFAIDVGAPCLRYAHARAEALDKTVHFAQANAESTHFDDASFDLIVSHILFHETGRTAFTNILQESHRLLAPGGVMAHLDIPQDRHCDDMYDSFLWDWEAYHNNETFAVVLRDLDYEGEAVAAGFAADHVAVERVPIGWPLLIGRKAA